MKKFIGITLVIFLLFSPALTNGKKTEKFTFDAKAAWTYIKEMSTDEMEGRRSGQPGGVMGEEYVASKFKEWGLPAEPGISQSD